MSILKTIQSPADLKRLSPMQFPALCQELREQIIGVVSNVGGHLASNLGVIELTVALHYLLNTPKDKIVWDTSNQAYAHKLLTGRREQFHTLRQYGGLSGFTKREESEYDTFNAGHAGTGVSAAYGMVQAREQLKQRHKVVCIVGDGAMTAGMTLEGLHHAGGLGKDFLVILNDNQMSISKNVGAISSYLNRTFTGEFYAKMREETGQLLGKIPHIGQDMQKWARRAEELAKGAILPGLLFEELGFRYAGPIDGHNFEHLLPTLENVLKMKGPVSAPCHYEKRIGLRACGEESGVVPCLSALRSGDRGAGKESGSAVLHTDCHRVVGQTGSQGQADCRDYSCDVRRNRPQYFREGVSGPAL